MRQKYIQGYVLKNTITGNSTIVNGPVLLSDALLVKNMADCSREVEIYLGSEIKIHKTKRLNNKLNLLTIIK